MSIGMGGHDAFRNRGTLGGVVVLAFVLIGGLVCLSPAAFGQEGGVNQGGSPYIHAQPDMNPLPNHGVPDDATQMERMREAERQKRLAADTAKLIQLSNELKVAVDQSSKNQLSLDALRKADEIEKLARDIKSWMKD